MKAALLTILAFSGTPAVATDWNRYHADTDQAIEYFIDLDSLDQKPDHFAASIRLLINQGQQEFQGKLSVNCQSAEYSIRELQLFRAGQLTDESADEASLPMGADTGISTLKYLILCSMAGAGQRAMESLRYGPGGDFLLRCTSRGNAERISLHRQVFRVSENLG